MDDWQLLQSYLERNSETAFRTLVNRHASLVYSVALRRVGNTQQAEEVAQTVFILLARKARGFRQSVILSGWLFRTTRFVASHAIRAEQRRQRREQEALAMQQLSTPDDTWTRISPVLDESLEHLGETDRNIVLLRFFNDKSHRETAAALGISEDAAKKRVTRALDKLRNFLAGRGVTLSATMLASAIASNATKAATPEIIAEISAKVVASGSAGAGILPPLISQVLTTWRWAKLQIPAAIGILALTAGFLFHSMTTQQGNVIQSLPGDEANAAWTAPAVTHTERIAVNQVVSRLPNLEETNTLLFRVVEARTGAAVANAKVAVNYMTTLMKVWAGDDLITDAQGVCHILIPDDLARLDVGMLKNGYVQMFYMWRYDQGEPLPSVYIFKVERGVAIGGFVREETGQPISGAEIVVKFPESGDGSSHEPLAERFGFIRELVAARTDAQGHWTCAIVPAGHDRFSLEVRQPQFATATVVLETDDRNYVLPLQHLAMKDLWASEAIIVLRPGFQLSGMVLNDAGRPMGDATVSVFTDSVFEWREWASTTTKRDGNFHLTGLAAGPARLNASADGFAPASQTVDVQSNLSNIVLRLVRGTTVSVRVVDEEGSGISGAWVIAQGPYGNPKWVARSTEGGWTQLSGILEGARNSLHFCAGAKGFFTSRDQQVDLSTPEPKLQLRRALKVSGRVLDAESGEAIAWFKVIPCNGKGVSGYKRDERKFGTNGNFVVSYSEFLPPFRIRIEADGYEPAMSPPIPPDPHEQWIELKLQRKDPSKAYRGTVLLPDGQPAQPASNLSTPHWHWRRGSVFSQRWTALINCSPL